MIKLYREYVDADSNVDDLLQNIIEYYKKNNQPGKADILLRIKQNNKGKNIVQIQEFIRSLHFDTIKKGVLDLPNGNGLITGNDLSDFYSKYASEIDKTLIELNWFMKSPESDNIRTLADIFSIGVLTSIETWCKEIEKKLFTENTSIDR